jgi:hypothetical protein
MKVMMWRFIMPKPVGVAIAVVRAKFVLMILFRMIEGPSLGFYSPSSSPSLLSFYLFKTLMHGIPKAFAPNTAERAEQALLRDLPWQPSNPPFSGVFMPVRIGWWMSFVTALREVIGGQILLCLLRKGEKTILSWRG